MRFLWWLAYHCAVSGHVITGSGYGTNADNIVWSTHCSRCGQRVQPKEEA